MAVKYDKRKGDWIVFSLNGEDLCAYTVKGTFAGEMKETRELLAFENRVSVDEIEVRIESKEGKQKC